MKDTSTSISKKINTKINADTLLRILFLHYEKTYMICHLDLLLLPVVTIKGKKTNKDLA